MRTALQPRATRIRELREKKLGANGEPMNQLQFALECGVSERTIQNIEAGRAVSEATARRIACVLDVPLESIFGVDESPLTKGVTPGRPEYYLPFVVGTWIVECHEHAGQDYRGEKVDAWVHHWRFELERDGNGIRGVAQCITPGFEHGRFDLAGSIDGLRFVHIEGIRSGGIDHFFRSILRYENDGRTSHLIGGYVAFNPEHKAVFVGEIEFKREPIRKESQTGIFGGGGG